MKNLTIWESASRPLFVRSVWLETASAGRGHHRHFILDYEPRQQQQKLKSAISPRSRRKESLQHSVSYDISDYDDTANGTLEPSEDLFLIGSAKVKLQQQPTQQQLKQQKLGKHYRRPSFMTKRHPNYEHYPRHRYSNELHELYSRRSSLQDIQSSLSNSHSNPDERLAERVLNWLDLAGKTGFLKPIEDTGEMEPIQKKSGKSRRPNIVTTTMLNSQKHQHNQQRATTTHLQRSSGNRKNSSQPRNTTTTTAGSNSSQNRRPDSVNHITIIFNKEGVPVRLNRPARNIDLCALSSSAITTRRLAGSLASARLYNSADCSLGGSGTLRYTSQTGLNSARRRLDSSCQDMNKSALQKLLHDENGCSNLHDAKKQLHIFMPSLPKKGLLAATTAASTDDTASGLSNTFSELCTV